MNNKLIAGLALGVSLFSANVFAAPAQSPIFVSASVPPLNMLVMGRDHKLYYEAYNDSSDLDGDGVIDIGYKGYRTKTTGGVTTSVIDYYGYFNSKVCYTYQNSRFEPVSVGTGTTGKQCSNAWSGDFLNYLATSRMDALRKVLYGGYRSTDSATETVLQGAFIPQDAHTWGKEYTSQAVDGYNISNFTPLSPPATGYRHLIAVASISDNGIPLMRVLTNTSLRPWNWVSIERPVAGNQCVNAGGSRITCTDAGPKNGWGLVSAANLSNLQISTWAKSDGSHPTTQAQMDTLFRTDAINSRLCGTKSITQIYTSGANNNPSIGRTPGGQNCTHNNYITRITGQLRVPTTGVYYFSVDGDDAVDVSIENIGTHGWYGGHGANNAGTDARSSGGVQLTKDVTYNITFRHEEVDGDDNWGLYWKVPGETVGTSTRTDYNIQVLTCPNDTRSGNTTTSKASLRESNCAVYTNGNYKPTGILHDYGQTNRMLFGLLTGSYKQHFNGGILRTNIQSFARELTTSTGQFCLNDNCGANTNVSGIVDNINRLRTYGFNYGSYEYNTDGCSYNMNPTSNLSGDPCYMWGTPTAEMMYETMRYFAGATTPTSSYDYSGTTPDSNLGLAKPAWIPPYTAAPAGSGRPSCSVPAMTVLSDINPNYDWKLPGSHWENSVPGTGNPSSIASFNASTETNAIGTLEGLHGTSVFIGESGTNADSAPTQKTITTLASIRGLAPEEPGKQGTYYSAGVARFGANNNIGGSKPLLTYAVALASPFPKIEFPVGTNRITLVPFAKSVQNPAANQYQATNQLVDFYVQKIANTSTTDADLTVNGGRPYAEFRINWEDSEQGADFDMDAIALYTLAVDNAGKLNVNLKSEYAAGGAKQHMGYTISGTNADGLYLEICDLRDGISNNGQRSDCDGQTSYRLNTPPGRPAGWCIANQSSAECTGLPPTADRQFTATGIGATILKDPLWYAAKYGTTAANWDTTGDGVPDNYFLVTNALTLKDQLAKAFNDLSQRNASVSRPAAGREPVSGSTSTAQAIYRTTFDIENWSGDLIKENVSATGVRTTAWKASEKIPGSRDIYLAGGTATSRMQTFNWSNLANKTFNGVNLQTELNKNASGTADTYGAARVSVVRGESCSSLAGCATLRSNAPKLGDIVGSSPVVVAQPQKLSYVADSYDGSAGTYATFKAQTRRAQVYVGANDGMLHAFDAATGVEKFAFVPTAIIPKLPSYTAADYASKTSDNHKFYVDGSIVVDDVYFDGAWRTVLVATLGAGGREIFALDVTDPDAIKLLWEFNTDSIGSKLNADGTGLCTTQNIATCRPSDMGYGIGAPTIARLHNGTWAAVFGNGYDSPNSTSGKAVLFSLNIQTGALIRRLDAQGTANTANGLSTPLLVDNNSDGNADYAYAGDLLGNLWRFDLYDSTNSNLSKSSTASAAGMRVSFGGSPLYAAKSADTNGVVQPITTAPSVVRHPSKLGYIIIFGTGKYYESADKTSTALQTLYGVWDRQTIGQSATSTPALTRSNLQAQSISSTTASFTNAGVTTSQTVRTISETGINWNTGRSGSTGKYGWYLDLKIGNTLRGERIVDKMIVFGEALIIATRTPNSDPCASGVDGFYYGLNPSTGSRTKFNVFDLNGDGKVDASDSNDGTVVSGTAGGAGGFIIVNNPRNDGTGGCVTGPDGKCLGVSPGPGSIGRQSWRVIPETTSP